MQKNKMIRGKSVPDRFICTSAFGMYAPMLVAANYSGEFMAYVVAIVCVIVSFGQREIWGVARRNAKFRHGFIIHQVVLWCLSVLIHPALAIGIMFLPTLVLSWYTIKLSDD
ncbi:hypothetical protein [Vibrio sp. WXL103]|uniref:hypothetical protein n=1 Tax=Vibrio sp. WXL103 TaxID=3450710 RepID=UPI003EC75370